MFYLILAILLVLFYIFVAPRHIKGTINVIIAVFLLVGLLVALMLGFLKIMQFPTNVWIGLIVVLVGIWAIVDLHYLDKEREYRQERRTRKHTYR